MKSWAAMAVRLFVDGKNKSDLMRSKKTEVIVKLTSVTSKENR